MKIGIFYRTTEGHTGEVAARMAEVLRKEGATVDLRPIGEAPDALHCYGAVILGGSIHLGKHDKDLLRWARQHATTLAAIPDAFFSVSLSAVDPNDEGHMADARRVIDEFLDEAGWRPDIVAAIGGALAYTHYGFIKRRVLKSIAGKGGLATDTSRDWDYTDYEAVEKFARDLLELARRTEPSTPPC